MKSNAKKSRNGFVRTVRAEASLNAYTRALGFVLTRDRDHAIKLLRDRIAASRHELEAAQKKNTERENPEEKGDAPVGNVGAEDHERQQRAMDTRLIQNTYRFGM